MLASTLADSVSRSLRMLSVNSSRKPLRLRAMPATMASAYSYRAGAARLTVRAPGLSRPWPNLLLASTNNRLTVLTVYGAYPSWQGIQPRASFLSIGRSGSKLGRPSCQHDTALPEFPSCHPSVRRWREGEPITRSSSVRQSAGHEPFTALQRRISAPLPSTTLAEV